jgi:hypothetical protein
MNQDQQSSINDELTTVCRQCLQMKEDLHGDMCSDCIEETLLNHLPLLKLTLEARYGPMLDQWLNIGKRSTEFNTQVCIPEDVSDSTHRD